ncbi:MAG TPA: GNAT family N-acetyltransferase [Nocardioidaceae bacterium]|nr:GNAT family N-acetyltransferase [Nocardioidaceae bacterium]
MTDARLRPLTTDDIPDWNRLLGEIEKADRTGEHYNEADLVEEMENPDIELGKDIVGAYLDDELVGFFSVYPRAVDGHLKFHLDGGVRPELRGQGIGTALAEAMRRRADEVHAEKHPAAEALMTLRGLSGNDGQTGLMRHIGLEPERWSFVMRADLSRELEAPPRLPDGLELRRYDDEVDAAMREAHNEAFLDHPNFTPWTEVMWKQWVSGSRNFRPHLSLVVLDRASPGVVVAYLQSNEYDAYFEQTGRREAYVGKVGTRREYRGRGLAGLLLRHALQEYKSAGYDEASLDVDSENPTGALGIYERAGFEVESRWTDYAAHVAPLTGERSAR